MDSIAPERSHGILSRVARGADREIIQHTQAGIQGPYTLKKWVSKGTVRLWRLPVDRSMLICGSQVTVGLFFAIAVLSVIARGAIRFVTRRALSLDDFLLFLAFAFLAAATGLMYHIADGFYLATAVQSNPAIYFQFSQDQIDSMLSVTLNENIFLSLAWSATFFVKFSFLAFFKQLIWHVNKTQYYYWGVVTLTILTWMFLTSEAFILCSDFGVDSSGCCHASYIMSQSFLIRSINSQMSFKIKEHSLYLYDRPRHRTGYTDRYTQYAKKAQLFSTPFSQVFLLISDACQLSAFRSLFSTVRRCKLRRRSAWVHSCASLS